MAQPTLDEQLLAAALRGKKRKKRVTLELETKARIDSSVPDGNESENEEVRQGKQEREKQVTAQEDEDETESEDQPGPAQPKKEEELGEGEAETDQEEPKQQPQEEEPAEDEDDGLVQVPDVVGQDPNSAEEQLSQVGLGVNRVEVGESEIAAVTKTEPAGGEEVESGTVVTLYVTQKKEDEDDEDEDDDQEEEDENEDEEDPEAEDAAEQAAEDALPEGAAAEGAAAEAGAVGAEAGAAAGAAAAGAAVSTAPIWGTALAIFLGICLLMFVVIMIFAAILAKCNEDSWTGTGARVGSTIASKLGLISDDVCKKFTINFGGGSSGGAGATASFGLTDAGARRQLAVASITVNAPQPRTSLEGISQGVITEIVNFKEACDIWAGNRGPCNVIVTGGTETTGGHAGGTCSHLSGDKADIDDTPLVNQFIEATYNRSGSRGSDPRYRSSSGVSYVKESNHWDIGGVGCDT